MKDKNNNGETVLTRTLKLKFGAAVLPIHMWKNASLSLRCYHCQIYDHASHLSKDKLHGGNLLSVKNYPISQTSPSQFHFVNCKRYISAAYGGCQVSKLQTKIKQLVFNSAFLHKDAAQRILDKT